MKGENSSNSFVTVNICHRISGDCGALFDIFADFCHVVSVVVVVFNLLPIVMQKQLRSVYIKFKLREV